MDTTAGSSSHDRHNPEDLPPGLARELEALRADNRRLRANRTFSLLVLTIVNTAGELFERVF